MQTPTETAPASVTGNLSEVVAKLLADWGLGVVAPSASFLLLTCLALLLATAAHFTARSIFLHSVRKLAGRTQTRWDDILVQQGVFRRLAHIAPALVLYLVAPVIFADLESLRETVERLTLGYMILALGFVLSAFLTSVNRIYDVSFEDAKERPIQSYVQVVQIILWLFAIILLVAVLIDRSPWALLGGLGAMTAILLLVFKDSIMGLVASIQLAANDMVRVGDWIEMPRYGADGDVIEILLTTVKIQNWDKTITTIPSYHLISDAFKNWRGMKDSGGRRIKRSLLLDLQSIRFVDQEMLERLAKIQYIQAYLDRKVEETRSWNQEEGVDTSSLVNGRRITNVGTFRAYIQAYLGNHPMIRKDMTFLVRQLAPTEKGLPLEIYVFSAEQRWAHYEAIQADIFDHILASVDEFDLRVVQIPTGADLRSLGDRATALSQ